MRGRGPQPDVHSTLQPRSTLLANSYRASDLRKSRCYHLQGGKGSSHRTNSVMRRGRFFDKTVRYIAVRRETKLDLCGAQGMLGCLRACVAREGFRVCFGPSVLDPVCLLGVLPVWRSGAPGCFTSKDRPHRPQNPIFRKLTASVDCPIRPTAGRTQPLGSPFLLYLSTPIW